MGPGSCAEEEGWGEGFGGEEDGGDVSVECE